MVGMLILSVLTFFFPIMQIYDYLGREFSNLGPIATFFWGVLVDVWVVTPLFVVLLLTKLFRRTRPIEN
jgi:hypothetical protein